MFGITNASNYAGAEANKGYRIITSSSSTVSTTEWNTEVRFTSDIEGTLTIQVPTNPDAVQTHELRIVVRFASTGTPTVSFLINSGNQAIVWPDDMPVWTNGKLYEISLSPIYSDGTKTYIVGYGKEITIPS